MKKCSLMVGLLFTVFTALANPLPAEEVFKLSAKKIDPNTFVLNWQIKPGYFLYKNRIQLMQAPNSNLHIGTLHFPPSTNKTDRLGNIYEIYRNEVKLPVSILGEHPGESIINLRFQGCADNGFCYPPQTKGLKVTINANHALTQVEIEQPPVIAETSKTTSDDSFQKLFLNHHWPLIVLSFLGFGLLLSFTPCVLPMVPILSGIIVGHGENLSTGKAFLLSLSYVLSMSFTYAVVGAVVALLGHNLQIIMQSSWAIGFFSVLFVVLALSMFDFYELRLPASWQGKLARVTRSQAGGHYLGAALMGALSTLILSPCVTAPLIGVLTYIAQSGNVPLGMVALFFLGFGMGLPLLLIGTSAGKLIPKSGQWMNTIKSLFGIIFLAVAIYLLQRILHPVLTMGLWGALLIFVGIYLGAFARMKTNIEKFRQGIGIIFLVYGVLILIGASKGNVNPLLPLAQIKVETLDETSSVKVVKTVGEVEQAFSQARGKPVMLDFYADWCASCKVIAKTVLQDPKIRALLNDFVVLKVDLSANNAETKALLRHFNVIAPPTFIFYDAKGTELPSLRLVGDVSTKGFFDRLTQALSS